MKKLVGLLALCMTMAAFAFGASTASAFPNPNFGGDGCSIEECWNGWELWQPGDVFGGLGCMENPLGGEICPGDDEGIEDMPGTIGMDGETILRCGPYILVGLPCPEPEEFSIVMPRFEPNPAYVTDDGGSNDAQTAQDAASEEATVEWVAPPADPADMFAYGDCC